MRFNSHLNEDNVEPRPNVYKALERDCMPYLKDVPILGYLFKQDSKASEFEELLIFITPKILSFGEEVAVYQQ